MSKHTPGPWIVQGPNIATAGTDTQPLGYVIAHCLNPYAGATGAADRVEANARLIAAAPDLLTELRKARAALKERLDELIESHTNPETGLITDNADLLFIESEQDLINSIEAAIAKTTGSAA